MRAKLQELLVLGILMQGSHNEDALSQEVARGWGLALEMSKSTLLQVLARLEEQQLIDSALIEGQSEENPRYRLLGEGRDAYLARLCSACADHAVGSMPLVVFLRLLDDLGPQELDARHCVEAALGTLERERERWEQTPVKDGSECEAKSLALAHLDLDISYIRRRLDRLS